MGLDMYAYVGRPGQRGEFHDQYGECGEDDIPADQKVSEPVELAYWRKHPNLHGWMEQLWVQKGRPMSQVAWPIFNGVELELTWNDIDDLERAVRNSKLPATEGFFFGKSADNAYYDQDLKFCQDAKAELFLGLKVFYNSSW